MKSVLIVLVASSSLIGAAQASAAAAKLSCSTLAPRAKGAQSFVSADGNLAAIFRPGAKDFSLVDASGNQFRFDALRPAVDATADDSSSPSNTTRAPLLEVRIVDENIVRVQKHAGKDASRFEFYRLQGASLHELAPPAIGTVCAVQPRTRSTACVFGDELVVGAQNVAFARTAPPAFETLRIKVGGTAASAKVAGLLVQVVSAKSEIELRVQLPSGNWTRSRIAPGDSFKVPTAQGELQLRPHLPGPGGVVLVELGKAAANAAGSAPTLSWNADGSRLVARRSGVVSVFQAQPGGRWLESHAVAEVPAAGLSCQ